MKVKELLKVLEQYEENTEIYVRHENFDIEHEEPYATIECKTEADYNKLQELLEAGRKVTRR